MADVYAAGPWRRPSLPPESGPRPGTALRGRGERRPARGHACEPEGAAPGARTSRIRRRLQGHRGVRREFGKARVRTTPIIESGALARPWPGAGRLGPGRGDAVRRLHHCGFNQIVNTWPRPTTAGRSGTGRGARAGGRRRGRRAVPLAGRGGVVHDVAGLKVVARTPYDANGVLLARREDGNPSCTRAQASIARRRVGAAGLLVPLGAHLAREAGTPRS